MIEGIHPPMLWGQDRCKKCNRGNQKNDFYLEMVSPVAPIAPITPNLIPKQGGVPSKIPKSKNVKTNENPSDELQVIKLRDFVKNHINLYWLQIERFFRYNGRTYPTYRQVSMGNKEEGFTSWHLFAEKAHFEQFVLQNVDRFNPPCLHITQQRYIYVPLLKDLLKDKKKLQSTT